MEKSVNMPQKEMWKNIPGYKKLYQASNLGKIKSYKNGKILRPWTKNKTGHLCVDLYLNNKRRHLFVHRLILETFIGPCPLGMECRHLDGNPLNNRLDNLCWGTRSENIKDSVLHGSFIGNKKLNTWKVRIIKRLIEDGYLTQKEIATIFGVDPSAISNIKRKKRWK